MSTDSKLYAVAQTIRPADITAPRAPVGGVVVVDARRLRQDVERAINRSLLWEEWLDVRREWCRRNHAQQCDAMLGDTRAVLLGASVAKANGCDYLLLEIV
jgi:hypothetical protein